MSTVESDGKTFELGLNEGQVLMHLARHTYTTLTQVVVEAAQNAIDANCKNIWIEVDMKKRNIVIANDGDGVDVEQFQKALKSVGKGVKKSDKLGRFGLGLISPLDKCRYFTFTSFPAGESKWLQWKFEASVIKDKADDVSIPFRRVGHQGMRGWRHAVSLLSIYGFTKDRQAAALDPALLANTVLEKLGFAMRKQGVTGHLKFKHVNGSVDEETIKPTTYAGEALPAYVYQDEHVGKVTFELYRAIRTSHGRKGQVVVSESGNFYPVSWNDFANQSRDLLNSAPIKVLGSGYFEGVIRAEGIELHPSRNKFVRENDAFIALCAAVEEWLIDIGQQIFDEEREERSALRYQRLGLRTLDRLNGLLHDEKFAHLRRALMALEQGTVSTGHVPPGGRKTTKEETDLGKRVGQGGTNVPKQPSEATSRNREEPKAPERPGDVPLVSEGPEGRRRQITKQNSGGLTFSHDMPEGSERLWELDPARGVIYFNVRHPTWLQIDEKDHMVMHLQEWIAIEALSMLLQPETAFPLLMENTDNKVSAYVDLMIVGGHKRVRPS